MVLCRIFSSWYSTVLTNTILYEYAKKDEFVINYLYIPNILNVLSVHILFTLILSKRALRQFLIICKDIYSLSQVL